MSSTSYSPSPETMTRASTAADTPAAATPGSTATDLPNLAEMAITTPVEDVDATRRMARLNFLLERSSLYAKILEARINQQKEEQAKKPAVEKDTAKPPKTTGKGKKRARASDSYDIAGHIDSSTLEKANKRARGEKVKEEEQTTSLPSMEQPDLITGARLKDYQLEGVRWIASLWENGLNGILADEMGLGKVLDHNTMHTSLIHGMGPFLIVCPLSVLHNWISEFEKFAPSILVCMYHGSPQHRAELRQTVLRQPTLNASLPKPKRGRPKKKADDELPEQTTQTFPVIVTTYDMVIRDRIHLAKFGWKYIVVDEGHRLKNMNCKLIQELKQYPSANRLILTGTLQYVVISCPIHIAHFWQNNLAELWSLLNFILPDIFNDLHSFQQWFNFSENTDLGDQTAGIVSQLHAILKPFLLRRLKTDVVTDLPPRKKGRSGLYEQALDALEKDEEKEEVEEVMDEKDDKRKLRKRTKPAAPAYLLEDDDDTYFDALERGDYDIPEETEEERRKKERDAAKKQTIRGVTTSTCKMLLCNSAKSALTHICSTGRRNPTRMNLFLDFLQFTTVLDIIQQWLTHCKDLEHCRIDGSTSPEDRREQMDWFNKSGHGHDDPRIFLLSTRAGGLGITLWELIRVGLESSNGLAGSRPCSSYWPNQARVDLQVDLPAHNRDQDHAECDEQEKVGGDGYCQEALKAANPATRTSSTWQTKCSNSKAKRSTWCIMEIKSFDADMDVLLDRRPEVFTQRSKGWTGKNEGTFEVYEAEKDEGNDGLARMGNDECVIIISFTMHWFVSTRVMACPEFDLGAGLVIGDHPQQTGNCTGVSGSVADIGMPRLSQAATNAASAESQQDVVMASEGVDNYELPKTLVTRIVKSAFKGSNARVLEGSTCLSTTSVPATAHELSRARGHKSVGAADVIKAIETIEFNTDGLVKFLEMDLEAYRQGTKKPKPAAKPKPKQGDATTTAGASVAASASASTPASASGRKLKIVVAPIRDDDETGPMEGEVVEMRQEDEEEEEVGEDVDELEDDGESILEFLEYYDIAVVDEEPDETVTEGCLVLLLVELRVR
ncbi:SNF2 family N-terminal domain [Rhizoctonia solani]|uniref:SNF2 family N-terminal domain n=1 Tax=Rhizoctonia solani TaxID=456999 RepID=A0A8H7I4S4_9AGAM|nr:SNF2 family N-terminal domain [Rhizoctonia solani]